MREFKQIATADAAQALLHSRPQAEWLWGREWRCSGSKIVKTRVLFFTHPCLVPHYSARPKRLFGYVTEMN